MPLPGLSDDEALFHLSAQRIGTQMIPFSGQVTFASRLRNAFTSSIGILESFALEILHLILGKLDFRSLSRLSRVSLRGKIIVESLPAYRDLIKHAPCALKVLGQTNLIDVHTSVDLSKALRSEQCVSCHEYGPFLFLPTCDRCCYECLHRNMALWVITPAQATNCFNLTSRQLKQLPTIHTIPGTYWVGWQRVQSRRLRLISVKQVKKLAIKVNGSTENIGKPVPPVSQVKNTNKGWNDYYMLKRLSQVSLEPLPRNPSLMGVPHQMPNDMYCGMASIPFPSLRPFEPLENGFWCAGCRRSFELWGRGQLSNDAISDLIPSDVNPSPEVSGLVHRARSRREFLEHIYHCPGVHKLISDLGEWANGATSGR